MKTIPLVLTSVLALCSLGALAGEAAGKLDQAPPPQPYAKVSSLVALPDFIPGLGTLYVDPTTLPAGPFLGYDADGKLAATIYMVPLAELEKGTAYDGLKLGSPNVVSVDIYYNAGHPGVEAPHAHVVLFHSRSEEHTS